MRQFITTNFDSDNYTPLKEVFNEISFFLLKVGHATTCHPSKMFKKDQLNIYQRFESQRVLSYTEVYLIEQNNKGGNYI